MIEQSLPLPGSEHLAPDPAVVVLSGGQDSVTCLGVALKKHRKVVAVSFAYGQRHVTELHQAAKICDARGIMHSVIDLRFFGAMVTSALTDTEADDEAVGGQHPNKPNLPASFVPNRNALFLTLAHAVAQEVGAKTIYTGVCQTDFSGYPDCRADFIILLQEALNLGYQTKIQIATPMMYLTKAETFELADQVGFLQTVLEDSHTCYNGDRTVRHEWGYGCGKCPACELRAKGFREFEAWREVQEPHTLERDAATGVLQIHGTIKNAVVCDDGLVRGNLYGDTKGRFRDGEYIHTSTVLEGPDDSGIIKTRNSVYKVELREPRTSDMAAQVNVEKGAVAPGTRYKPDGFA